MYKRQVRQCTLSGGLNLGCVSVHVARISHRIALVTNTYRFLPRFSAVESKDCLLYTSYVFQLNIQNSDYPNIGLIHIVHANMATVEQVLPISLIYTLQDTKSILKYMQLEQTSSFIIKLYINLWSFFTKFTYMFYENLQILSKSYSQCIYLKNYLLIRENFPWNVTFHRLQINPS